MDVVVRNFTKRINKLEAIVSDVTVSLEFTPNETYTLKATIKTHLAEHFANRGTSD